MCELVTSKNQFNQDKSSATFNLVVASVSNNNALSFNDKSSSTFKLVVVSVINKFSNGPTNDSPAKQRPVSNDDPVIERSFQLHVPMSIIHLSVDCWIKTKVSKETAARFGQLFIVENHYL